MSEKKFEAGQWWRTRDGKIKHVIADTGEVRPESDYRFVAIDRGGSIATYTAEGYEFDSDNECDSDLIEHLPDCTGFDWVPEKWPKYYTTLDSTRSNIAFIRRISASTGVFVNKNGGDDVSFGWTPDDNRRRTEITEEEALALLKNPEPPKENPPIDPGEGYRLLEDGEIIELGDEWYSEVSKSWKETGENGRIHGNDLSPPRRRRIPPHKKRIRLWMHPDGREVVHYDVDVPGPYREIHVDSDGFYVLGE